jgi:CubicO group peptidase (beta-lactamase class C family)
MRRWFERDANGGLMSAGGLSTRGIERLRDTMAGHVERRDVHGLAWLVQRRGEVQTGTAGVRTVSGDPVERDSIFRIASMTKPVVAAAALILMEECVLRLDDPVDQYLPELADRHVLTRPEGPIDDTVPAERKITVRDLLTLRFGLGYDFSASGDQPLLGAMDELALGVGPPAPDRVPEPDEWMRRIGSLPLERQPGERWLYHFGSEVLGVLVARASGRPLDVFLEERLFEPLGMTGTGFHVQPDDLHRFGACWGVDVRSGERSVYDNPDGQWSHPPAFPSGGGGLVSTLDDYRAFAAMLLAGGVAGEAAGGERILSRPSVDAMTMNHLTGDQLATAGPSSDGALGWGFGVGVQVRRSRPARSVGSYGWDGGLGSSWASDPAEGVVGVLLTTDVWASPVPPAAVTDFWTCVYAAIDD